MMKCPPCQISKYSWVLYSGEYAPVAEAERNIREPFLATSQIVGAVESIRLSRRTLRLTVVAVVVAIMALIVALLTAAKA